MIVTVENKQRRFEGFEVWRKRGIQPPQYYLVMFINKCRPHLNKLCGQVVDIPLEYGGKLAMTSPSYQDCYTVSFKKLPPDVQNKVRAAILYIEENGTPQENDEPIFSY